MNLTKALVAVKMSKFEWDAQRYRCTARQLLARYRKAGLDVPRIVESHERQLQARLELKQLLPKGKFLLASELNARVVQRASIVISLGGDNHFQTVAHHLRDELILGINSDPRRSEGSLTCCTAAQIRAVVGKLQRDEWRTERWSRMEVLLNGKVIPQLSLSEVYMGERMRSQMSRHCLTYGKNSEEHKNSGLLCATGSGSSGWFDSACRYRFPKGHKFGRQEAEFHFLATEPYEGHLSRSRMPYLVVPKGREIKVQSLNDTLGVLTIDAQIEKEFPEGAVARIRLGRPLNVVVLR